MPILAEIKTKSVYHTAWLKVVLEKLIAFPSTIVLAHAACSSTESPNGNTNDSGKE